MWRRCLKSLVQSRTAGASPQCRCCYEVEEEKRDTTLKARRSLHGMRRSPHTAACRHVTATVVLVLYAMLCTVLAMREWVARWVPVVASSGVTAAGAPGSVPKIIHQMFKDKELPAKWRDVPAAWASLHPPGEFTYMLWTDEELRELIATDYPWLLEIYDSYPYATQRWDASRLAVLHKCVPPPW